MTTNKSVQQRSLLRELNIFGLDYLSPLILAALADGRSLLLIGPHGSAKSELLNRLALALSLNHRHYNASLISFDDLLGYPVPNARRDGLQYLRTPVDLWDAESVFLDEISRCRPELQNKLFSIIHERRVQGHLLAHLRYCWSAMNPPVSMDGDDLSEDVYHGSLPLDPALADRFAWLAELPAFEDLSAEDRHLIIARGGEVPTDWPDLAGLIDKTRKTMNEASTGTRLWIERYVHGLVAPLKDARFSISGRRAVMLAGNITAVYAACLALDGEAELSDAAYMALKWSLPQRAQGRNLLEHQISAAHKEALKRAGEPQNELWERLRLEADPVKRVALAMQHEGLNRIELSQLVADAWASLPHCERFLFARNLLPSLNGDRLTASVLEMLLEPMQKVLAFTEQEQHPFSIPRNEAKQWDRLLASISRLRRDGDPEYAALGNMLYTLFVVEKQRFDVQALIERDRQFRSLFGRQEEVEVAG